MITSLKIKFRGVEPIIMLKGKKSEQYKWEWSYGIFYPIRRLKLKLENKRIKKDLISRGHKLYKCEGCGEGWCEYIIDDPNDKITVHRSIFVCRHCVDFYDWKGTWRRLYYDIVDFRDK